MTQASLLEWFNIQMQSGLKGTNDIKIVSGSQWYFRGRPSTFNFDYVMESWSNLNDSGMKNGKHGVRAFADVGIFFRSESVQDLAEYESIFARVQLFSLKVICAYLVSDLSLLTDFIFTISRIIQDTSGTSRAYLSYSGQKTDLT